MKHFVFAPIAIGFCGSAYAQGHPPDPRPGASTPVQVMNAPSNPVPVTGVVSGDVKVTGEVKVTNSVLNVAVLNDIESEPYMVSQSAAFGGGQVPQFKFDVPDGKRLIIETITVRFALDTPSNGLAQFRALAPGGLPVSGDIAMQPQGAITDFGSTKTWLIGTHSIKLRVDANAGKDDEFLIAGRVGNVSGTTNVFVAGYLVPLP